MDFLKLPEWIEVEKYNKENYLETFELISKNKLNTVCLEANCPNRYECFSKKIATFMILGDVCTRNCRYCNIKKGKPLEIDEEEPKRISNAVKKMNLKYVVITCVTRDDLSDGGAGQFFKTVNEIRNKNPCCKIELLISDLKGNWKALEKIISCLPDVLNHNIEIVEGIFSKFRPQGDYKISLELLEKAKKINPRLITKSGFMVGLGETKEQISRTFNDLKKVKCDIITIGQYLQPSLSHCNVKKYYTPEEFKELTQIANKIGLKNVIAGPLVRSSYKAQKCFENGKLEINKNN